MPLNCHFCDAGRPANAAEMIQMPRLAAVCPPRRQCRAVAVDVREDTAENAKRIHHKDIEKYREEKGN